MAATCNICCRPASDPFRVYDASGRVIHGCVDAFHDGHIFPEISESARWHNRPEARAMRRANAQRQRVLERDCERAMRRCRALA